VTECLHGRASCSPASYVAVYRQVRRAIRTQTDGYLLVGPTSPGTVEHAARWMDGTDYLRAILDLLHPLEVDGIALHAYAGEDGLAREAAGSLDHFAFQLQRQIDAAAASGYLSTPLFLTEMNEYTAPDPEFVRAAYAWIDAHNARSGQDILAACWFVYHDETGQWRSMALEGQPAVLEAARSAAEMPPGR
jgi:hypothetical protein